MAKMTDTEILNAVERAERASLGWGDGQLSYERETMLEYYNQEPYGNEIEGRSQIVTSEVADTVEWILPSLLKIFTSGDKAVEFDPQGPEDYQAAKEATDTCNYVFYHQNRGFHILYTMFKDALIQKNGYVKVYYDKYDRKKKESYQGLTDDQLTMLVQDGSEIIGHTEYQGVDQNQQPVTLHDVQIEITEPYGKVCLEPVPPEETLVSQELRDVDVQKAHFFGHRRKLTISDLKEMGFDTSDISSDDNWLDTSLEAQARNQFVEMNNYQNSTREVDESMRFVWVTEAYIRMDIDGDGIAELVKVIKVPGKVLDYEEVEVIPFAAITPIIMSHRHHGKSLAEVVADLQLLKSTITRQVLDNIYLTNSPRQAVLSNIDGSPQANLDDLLTVRPGGIVREYQPNAVRDLTIPFMGVAGLQVMEYLDGVKENRTGVTRYNQGIDANSLNKTASGINSIMTASQQRIELIARVFAETGVTQIFKLIMKNLAMYHGRELTIRLDKEFVSYDPRNWNTEMDVVINVGIGTGNKDAQLVHLQTIAQSQALAVQAGGLGKLVTLKNIYNTQAKICQNAGFKDVNDFWTDPDTVPQQAQQQPPDPKMVEVQGKMQLQQAEMQQNAQLEQGKMQYGLHLEQVKKQADDQRLQAEMYVKQAEMDRQSRSEEARMELEKYKAELAAATQILASEISAKNQADLQMLKAEQSASEQFAESMDKAQQSEAQNAQSNQLAQMHKEAMGRITDVLKQLTKPKSVVRGPDGKIVGVQ